MLMKNKKETLLILTIIITISIIIFNRDKLYEAKYTEPKDTLLAITINGEISTTFPTTDMYTGTVECTTGTGKVEWNGTKWILTTSGITKGSTKCNAIFKQTLKQSILANNEVKTPITTPGSAISTADEALLASAEDDNGTSYYFRGAVTNNYVEFANKCWRIVRVGGDGSVKLILHNDNTTGVANPCNSANNSTSAAFARYTGTTYTSKFNTNYNDNAYIGFMYGTAGASDYATTHANTNKSTILTNLETWYNNNLKTYESVIADTVWCNDKTNVTDTSYNPWSYGGNATGLGYGTNKTYYGATKRLVSTSGSAGGTGPSLKCNGELNKLNSKVGLITADELAFAGYAYGLENTTTYLQENAGTNWWWSLSPCSFSDGRAFVWCVRGSSGLFGGYSVNSTYGVRPSISLKPFTNVTGNGTSSSPYIISM